MSSLTQFLVPVVSVIALTTAATTASAQAMPPPTAPAASVTGAASVSIATTTVSPATIKANPEDKVTCKTEMPIGSRLGGKRVCMKKSDWDAQSADARRQRDFSGPAGIGGSH